MSSTCIRLLDTLDLVGQTYFRLKHTELWATFKICEVAIEAHRLYRKWRSIPYLVSLVQSPDGIRRNTGVQELEFLSSRYTGTKSFSERALKLGALPGILSCLSSASPAAVCASLCILSDVYSHPDCKRCLSTRVIKEIFALVRMEDLHTRLRSALLLALLSTEEEARTKLKRIAVTESDFVDRLTDLVCKPLPERYQSVIDTPDDQMNVSTLKRLRCCETQVRKSGVALTHLLFQDKCLLQKFNLERILPVLIRSIRANDAGLRVASLRSLKLVIKESTPCIRSIGDSIAQCWREIVPKLRDMELLQAIEDLGMYPELLDRLVDDVYFLHRLPNLLTCTSWSVRTVAFRSLYPFTLADKYRWKVVRSGLLHLIFKGLFDRDKSIHISALICLSQLSACSEIFLAVQAEIARQPRFLSKMGEYLVYLVLSFPADEIGQGALKLLGEAAPKLKNLPRKIFPNLSMILSSSDAAHKTGTAKLVMNLAHVERFRDKLLKSTIVTELIAQTTVCDGSCKAAVLEALAKFSVSRQVADRIVSSKGLTDSLWNAQESDNHELAVAALELLRILSKSLGEVPGATERSISMNL